jgi:hypothetical protein
MKLIRDILTDYDGQTYDTARVMAVAIIAAMLTFQAFAVWHSHSFDVQSFGMGMASVLGALGIAIAGDNHKRP